METAHEAADELEKEGFKPELIDLRTIRPLDVETIVNSIKKSNRCIIIEEAFPYASISSEIAYRIQKEAFDYLDAPVVRVTQSDTPFAFSTSLIEEAYPSVETTVKRAKEIMYAK